ncbi:MAG: SDR family oxidoreductase [Nocardia sp.]|nr:SDR family oxidoreductase [Nocardia sp.]
MTTRIKPGRHIVITGGSSGLGLEIAHQLAPRGVRLTLVARNTAKLDAARAEIGDKHPGALVETLSVDVSDQAALDAAFSELAAAGPIDVLVNSAGILREGYFEDLTDDDFRAVMDVNLFGTINAARAVLPHLKASRGQVVNIASVAGLTGVFGYTPYCASKHALVGFTDALRYELEPQGVSVVLVCPGEFDSPMVDALDRTRTPENREHTLTIPKLSVDAIAKATIKGIDRDDRVVVPGVVTQAVVAANRLLPAVAGAVGRRAVKKVYQGPSVRGTRP